MATTQCASAPTCRGFRCLDRDVCFAFASFEAATVAQLLHERPECDAETVLYQRSVAYVHPNGNKQRISVDDAQELMQCVYTDKLLFQTTSLVRNYPFWGYTTSSSGGFELLAKSLSRADHVSSKVAIGHVSSLADVERNCLGLFSTSPLDDGELIGEYTGVVQLDLDVHETPRHDAYGLCYPSVYEAGQLYLSALEYGNELRCINHSSTPNARFTPMIHDGILHVFCFAIRSIGSNEQIFVDYGPTYWRRAGVTPISV